MNIVEVISDLGLGGAQTFCVSLSKELAKNSNNHVTIISFQEYRISKFSDSNLGENLHYINLSKKSGFSILFLHRLRETIKSLHPDIIHSHLNSVGYLCLLFFCKNIPIFQTIHSEAGKDINPIVSWLLKKRIHQKKWNITLVGISKTITSQAKVFYKTNKIITINNGIERPGQRFFNSSSKIYDFVSCGRLVKSKGFDKVLIAFSMICRKSEKLVIIGDGKEMGNLKLLSRKLGIEKQVIFTGLVDNPSLYLSQSKVFVLPSEYEGNPITILEAMSMGLPVISSNVGGIPDVIKNKKNGYLLSPFASPAEYSIVMERLLSNPKMYSNMSLANLADVNKWFMDSTAKMYSSAFSNSIISTKKPKY